MWLALLAALAVLGFALLIKQFDESSRELKKPFLIIVVIFLVLYIGATIFVSYNISAYSAEINKTAPASGKSKVIQQNLEPVDLRTSP